MSLRDISRVDLANKVKMGNLGPSSMTRRQFARKAAGTAMIGAALGAGCFKPARALPPSSSEAVPIPGGTPALGGVYHIFGPTPDGSFDPIDAEPATIGDFNGFVGLS